MLATFTQQILDLIDRPESATDKPMGFWSIAMPRLRRSGMLGPLAADTRHVWEQLPLKVRDQFQAALTVADRQRVVIENEIRKLERILEPDATKGILLKGAAYQILGLPNSRGRLASDIDLMVPRADIDKVEKCLLESGWEHLNRSTYDQRYYRKWMHELPPLQHRERGTVLDLHHGITPPVSRVRVDSAALIDAAQPVEGHTFRVLAPADLVLHSVCHLLSDGEFPHGLRDLYDIRELIRHFSESDGTADFWGVLTERAGRLGLERYLFHVVTCLKRNLGLEPPQGAIRALDQGRPGWPVAQAMSWLMESVVLDETGGSVAHKLGQQIMLARAHYLRMPMSLLIPHLARKSWQRIVPQS